jgi:5'-nucleotidase
MVFIVLSNDDGVYAQGLQTLQQELQKIADLKTFAPDRDRSGASNSLTLSTPLRVQQIEDNVMSVQGTPTDCVHLALTGLLPKLPDMVISGINAGSNMGDDVWYSGTVAAAVEGRFLGLPSIAVSLTGKAPFNHYDTAARVVRDLVLHITANPLPAETILNVNVPPLPYEKLKGFAITRLGTRHKAQPLIARQDPRGRPVYWIGPAGDEHDATDGTDFAAIHASKVSITPLRVDLTREDMIDPLRDWAKDFSEPQSPNR